MSASGGLALVVATLVGLGMIIGFSIQATQINPQKPFVQGGNFTWDIWTGSQIADSLVVKYSVYQGPSYYEIQLAQLPRPLAVPGGLATSQNWVEVRMHLFDPPLTQISPYAWWEFIAALSTNNLALLQPDAPCYFTDPPICNVAGWSGGGNLGINALGFSVTGSFPNYDYVMQIFMQTIDESSIDWTNSTFYVTGPLILRLLSV